MNEISRWRTLADSFPCLVGMVSGKRIPADYTPETLIVLCSNASLSTSERSIFSFLLHTWNQYDSSFTLVDRLLWESGHRKAFVHWANGRTLADPLRYF